MLSKMIEFLGGKSCKPYRIKVVGSIIFFLRDDRVFKFKHNLLNYYFLSIILGG